MPFRKPELRDHIWYYTSDGVLRNGARSVGRKGPAATTGDVVIMRLAHQQLTFLVNDVPFADAIPNVVGAPLFATVQIYRKGDAVSLTAERFDEATQQHIKFFSWSSVSIIGHGPLTGHPAAVLSRQRTLASSCYNAPDLFGVVVPSTRSAAAIGDGMSAEWRLQIERCKTAIYIGLEQSSWTNGQDWWCREAENKVWYYASDGSLRTGDTIVGRSIVTFNEPPPTQKATSKLDLLALSAQPTPTYKPFIPALRSGDYFTLKLENKSYFVV